MKEEKTLAEVVWGEFSVSWSQRTPFSSQVCLKKGQRESDVILSWKTLNDHNPHGFHQVNSLCHYMCADPVCVLAVQSVWLCDSMHCSLPGFSVPWKSPGQNIGVGSHSLLQGIFPTQGSTWVSCVADRFFTVWATREALVPSLIIPFSQDTCDLWWEMVLESHFMMPAEACLFLEPQFLGLENPLLFPCPQTFKTFPHRVQGSGEHLWEEDKKEVGGLRFLTSTRPPALLPFEIRITIHGLRARALKSDDLGLNAAPPLTVCGTRSSYLTTLCFERLIFNI